MSDSLLDAIRNLPPVREKKHFVMIQGKKCEVSLQKKLEIIKQGEENYAWTKFGPALRTKQKRKTQYSVLQSSTRGYSFEQGDIHWPNTVVDGGDTWLIESE